jgi:VIT1/CCC1 family predicted Fe2+/Mn2+ transporter
MPSVKCCNPAMEQSLSSRCTPRWAIAFNATLRSGSDYPAIRESIQQMARIHRETHRTERIGWLRAAVLGANDGVISVSSLVVGVAAAGATAANILLTGIAGLVAGAMSMAAGEYVSVKSQEDTENADLKKETVELQTEPERELEELTSIYMGRGLDEPLARQVAMKLTANDALAAHARDELGITDTLRARPIQAAITSAIAFAVGAMVPIAAALLAPPARVAAISAATAIVTLIVLGATAAYAGNAPVFKGALRVAFWGAMAMALTALVGRFFGAAV